ncbi:outer membrane beta-barrel protein [Microbulbifer epialgicus]|uniref:Outer membrane beta-barrel protein n=1 Tax=Microbulbifer epialgicus TaxID=393907 RepID=A0ABV4NZE6_9GAMM
MRNWLTDIALFVLMAFSPVALMAGDSFSEGTEAFKQGKYRKALKSFEAERESGNNSAKLRYNIGVTLMKLERFSEATLYFHGLLNTPRWRDLARYNLALAAELGNRELAAAKHYRFVRTNAASENLRDMADRRLRLLAEGNRGEDSKPWLAMLSLSAGHDDNAYALQNELLSDSSIGADSFAELFAWGQYRLSGKVNNGWRVHGYGFGRKYKEYENLDLASVRTALSHDRRWGSWNTELGLAAELVTLGGESVSQQAQILSRATRNWGRAQITVAYSPGYYFGGEEYAYLEGWRQRFELGWQRPLFSVETKLFYRYDDNDREGQEKSAGDYYSYSPARHTLSGTLDWKFSPKWNLSTGVEYRRSFYNENNRITDNDGNVENYRRESDRFRSWMGAKYRVTPKFSVSGKYQHIDNDENRNVYTYDKGEFSFGIGYTF